MTPTEQLRKIIRNLRTENYPPATTGTYDMYMSKTVINEIIEDPAVQENIYVFKGPEFTETRGVFG